MKEATVTLKDETLHLAGHLHVSNVMQVLKTSMSLLQSLSHWRIDFSGLTASDSSGLALVLQWVKLAREKNRPLDLQHFPADLTSIAKAARLDELIPAS